MKIYTIFRQQGGAHSSYKIFGKKVYLSLESTEKKIAEYKESNKKQNLRTTYSYIVVEFDVEK